MVNSTNDESNPAYQKALAAAAKMENCLASGKLVEQAVSKLITEYPEVAQNMIDNAKAEGKAPPYGYSIDDVTVQNLPKITGSAVVGDCLKPSR